MSLDLEEGPRERARERERFISAQYEKEAHSQLSPLIDLFEYARERGRGKEIVDQINVFDGVISLGLCVCAALRGQQTALFLSCPSRYDRLE